MMSYQDFIRAFAPIAQVFGKDNFPPIVLERIHYRVRDLSQKQLRELMDLIIDTCEFSPKVPRIVELANIVRARHAEGPRSPTPTESGPRTPEVGQHAVATIREIFSRAKTVGPQGGA